MEIIDMETIALFVLFVIAAPLVVLALAWFFVEVVDAVEGAYK